MTDYKQLVIDQLRHYNDERGTLGDKSCKPFIALLEEGLAIYNPYKVGGVDEGILLKGSSLHEKLTKALEQSILKTRTYQEKELKELQDKHAKVMTDLQARLEAAR